MEIDQRGTDKVRLTFSVISVTEINHASSGAFTVPIVRIINRGFRV